ncbi:MAG: DNA alkylation repair protein [Planctomycetota bacterium]|nr:MAG: DNA alkylation repair protein [Planctomycetota bacterium]
MLKPENGMGGDGPLRFSLIIVKRTPVFELNPSTFQPSEKKFAWQRIFFKENQTSFEFRTFISFRYEKITVYHTAAPVNPQGNSAVIQKKIPPMPITSQHLQTPIESLQAAFQDVAKQETKLWWEAYLKGTLDFRGVGIPQIRSVLAQWRHQSGVDSWPATEQFELALQLFEYPWAEDKLAGILQIQLYLAQDLPWKMSLPRYEYLFERELISDWNTCDWFCIRVLSPLIASQGKECADKISAWDQSPNLWQARASVVAFVKSIAEESYRFQVLQSCSKLIRRPERFAKTGVGWVLREISKFDMEAVSGFVEQHRQDFSRESLKNALKYADQPKKRS